MISGSQLWKTFDAGNVEGSGRDTNGRFTFTGTYDNVGRVRMIKQYNGRPHVLFEGTSDGDGTISGQCSTGPLVRVAFALTPMRSWTETTSSADEEE